MQASKTYNCTRCAGHGRIDFHANVLGGVCFKCHGSGKQASKPAVSSITWAVLGINPATGERFHAYNIRARSADLAISKARVTYEGASAAFQQQVTLDDAVAVPYDDFAVEAYGQEA